MQVDLSLYNTIIFDFGGVIFDIDPERTRHSFNKLYGSALVDRFYQNEVLMKFEKGQITANDLRKEVQKITGITVKDEIFDRAWNAMLIDYKPKRIERIQMLGKTHKLLMLSNTNDLHFAFFSNKLKREYGVTFYDLFDSVYLSHEMGLLKPDKEIYKQVLIQQNLDPERTLFIEDTKENAEAAKVLGIETLIIPRNGSFYEYFL